MSEFLVAIFIQAHMFCSTTDLIIVPCIDAYMECVLDDDKSWCEENINHFYTGK
jgi:hypothetical protein